MPHTYSIHQPAWWVYLIVVLFSLVFVCVIAYEPHDHR